MKKKTFEKSVRLLFISKRKEKSSPLDHFIFVVHSERNLEFLCRRQLATKESKRLEKYIRVMDQIDFGFGACTMHSPYETRNFQKTME